MGLGGAAGLSSAANAFVGMVEAPLLIRPYMISMGRNELLVVMTTGMSTISGTAMVLYATFTNSTIANALCHLLIASLISIPAAVMTAKVMIPGNTHTNGYHLP